MRSIKPVGNQMQKETMHNAAFQREMKGPSEPAACIVLIEDQASPGIIGA